MPAAGLRVRVASYYVTGGTGFLGSHLLPRLRQRGEVTVLTRPGTRVATPGVRAEEGDVLRPATLAGAAHADVLLHMAAMAFVPDSIKDPAAVFDANARGTLNVLEAARKARDLRAFLLMSTGQVYGKPERVPIHEDDPLRPASPYAASKVAAEALTLAYATTYGLPVVIVRPFNVYGPGQSLDFLVPSLVRQLKQGQRPVVGDTSPVRDFTFVDDFVELLLLCTEEKAARGQVFNGGSGHGTRVADVVAKLMRLAGVEGEPTVDRSRFRPGEVPAIVASAERAQKLLGWAARTPLDDGLRRTWDATPQ
jgi:UDP-glucose 4-epimerase